MADRTYKLIELVGVSENSYAEATQNAVKKASESLKGLSWFEVSEMRGVIADGRVSEFQVKLKVGFRLLDGDDLGAEVIPVRTARRRMRAVRRGSRVR